MTFHFDKSYFALALIFTAVEIFIALFVRDKFIRPLVGDVLVVVLVYLLVSAVLKSDYRIVALGAFLFACLVEGLQYFDYVAKLGLENNRVLSVILGRTFAPVDFAAYFAGFLSVLFCEKIYRQRNL